MASHPEATPVGYDLLAGGLDLETFWAYAFALTWTQHGGSGSNLTLSEALALDVPRFLWWGAQVEAHRQAEYDALKRAHDQAHAAARRRR